MSKPFFKRITVNVGKRFFRLQSAAVVFRIVTFPSRGGVSGPDRHPIFTWPRTPGTARASIRSIEEVGTTHFDTQRTDRTLVEKVHFNHFYYHLTST